MSTKCKEVFKWIFFGILVLVITTPITMLFVQGVTDTCVEYGIISKAELEKKNLSLITDKIYVWNGFLCVLSFISAGFYLFMKIAWGEEDTYRRKKKVREKPNWKKILKTSWPCILLVVFLLWTAVGCIQASMEAAAEAALKDDKIEVDSARNIEIANWSSGDRMANAADRAWNGCANLKDGYWSFLFYAMVVIDVVMLGKESNRLKKILLRVLLCTSLVLVFLSFLSFWNPTFLGGAVKYNRAIFNNSNHYGYYLCITTVLSAMLWMKEENLYFKVVAAMSFALMSFMLIVNNTFGSYLGVMVAMLVIVLVAIGKWVREKLVAKTVLPSTTSEMAIAIVATAIFTLFTFTIVDTSTKIEEIKKNEYGIISNLSYNSFSGTQVLTHGTEGFSSKKSESNRETIVQRNFAQLGKDIGIIWNSFLKSENENSEENQEQEKPVEQEEKNNPSGLTTEVSKTGSGRGEVWIKSFDLIRQRPIFGWGLENLLNEFYYQFGINEGRTHNLILQLAGTTGIFGMLFYMVAVIAIFFKVLARHKNWGIIEYVTVPIFIAYMVSSLFGNSAFYTSPYFMLILGMMIAVLIYEEKKEGEENERK